MIMFIALAFIVIIVFVWVQFFNSKKKRKNKVNRYKSDIKKSFKNVSSKKRKK